MRGINARYATPLRYPGGKQKLAPFLREIIQANKISDCHYVEPYAGGVGAGMSLLMTQSVGSVHINDSCPLVYSFWLAILRHPEEFCRRITRASLTVREWLKQREILNDHRNHDRLDVGFAFFFLNRCSRSGIPQAGPIGGYDQTGNYKIDARFTRKALISRVEAIASKADRIKVRNWDAEKYMQSYISKLPKNTLIYFDPPYFNQADRLYRNHYANVDHQRIATTIQRKVKLPWIVSYDAVPEIEMCYRKRRSFVYSLQYSAASAYKGRETFIFSDKVKIPETSAIAAIRESLRKMAS